MVLEKLKGEMEEIDLLELAPINIVVTGRTQDNNLVKMLAENGRKVDFVPMSEEAAADLKNFSFKDMKPAIDFAQKHNSNLIVGYDAANNRISVAARRSVEGNFQLLTVHQLAILFTIKLIKEHPLEDLIFVKSSLITQMIDNVLGRRDVKCIEKIIEPGTLVEVVDEIAKSNENAKVFGITENQEFYDNQLSLEALVSNIVEMADLLHGDSKTLFDHIFEIYEEFGFYKEKAFVVEFVNDAQKKQIIKRMDFIRRNLPFIEERLGAVKIIDYKKGTSKNLISLNTMPLDQKGYNILKLELQDGLYVIFAPSDDRIQYFVGSRDAFRLTESFADASKNFDERAIGIMQIINKM
ncbi:MAG: hypothetical protein ACFCUU_03590 [Cyclobacteriaceae bacterium]